MSISRWADTTRISRHVPACAGSGAGYPENTIWKMCIAQAVWSAFWPNSIAGLIDTTTRTVHAPTLGEALQLWDVTSNKPDSQSHFLYRAAPGGAGFTTIAFSQSMRYPELDLDRKDGCIRNKENAYSQDGGLTCCSAISPNVAVREDCGRG